MWEIYHVKNIFEEGGEGGDAKRPRLSKEGESLWEIYHLKKKF